MPYIDQNTRTYLAPFLNRLLPALVHQPEGVLNYVITRLLITWAGPTPTYARFNAVIGVLRCAEAEFYRRMIAPYEDVKRGESGDVYPPIKETFGNSRPYTTYKGDTPHERE